MNRLLVPYRDSISLLREADVLLFRPEARKKWHLPSIGNLIAKYTGGEYSHVALAAKDKQRWMLVEFREWYGGRATSLVNQFPSKSGLIDVYRVIPSLSIYKTNLVEEKYETVTEEKKFSEELAFKITDEMYRLTGLPYGWEIIFKLAKVYIPFFRLFDDKKKFENDVESNVYVCSSAVNYVYRKYYIDPVPNIGDSYTKPNDLAQSPLFNYQFTII